MWAFVFLLQIFETGDSENFKTLHRSLNYAFFSPSSFSVSYLRYLPLLHVCHVCGVMLLSSAWQCFVKNEEKKYPGTGGLYALLPFAHSREKQKKELTLKDCISFLPC